MSALAKLRKAEPALAPMLPEQIRERIAELEAEQVRSLSEQEALAEATISGPDTAAAEVAYKANIDRGVQIESELSRLKAGLASVERKATEQASAAQAAELAGLRKRVGDLLDQRIGAAQAFEVAMAAAVKALHTLADLSERALAAWPGAQPDVGVTALGNAAVVNLVSAEMFRLGRVAGATGQGPAAVRPVPSLPGIKAPRLDVIDAPQDVEPMRAAIEKANALARDYLEGRR